MTYDAELQEAEIDRWTTRLIGLSAGVAKERAAEVVAMDVELDELRNLETVRRFLEDEARALGFTDAVEAFDALKAHIARIGALEDEVRELKAKSEAGKRLKDEIQHIVDNVLPW